MRRPAPVIESNARAPYRKIGLGEPIREDAAGVHKRLDAARPYVSWQGRDAIDVGCGNGAYTQVIAREAARVVGVDFERRWLSAFDARVRSLARPLPMLQAAAESLPVRDASFDVAFCIETLEHVRDDRSALAELFRLLRPGGHLVLTVPNKWYLFETHGLSLGPVTGNRIPFVSWLPPAIHSRIAAARIYTSGGVRRLLDDAGFAGIHLDHVMPPLDKLAASPAQRPLRAGVGLAEHTFLRRFGVSIVAVAQKP